jgi:hypothetical protein
MTTCAGSGLLRGRSFAFEQFLIVYGGAHDLRWALAALALRSLAALYASGRALLVTAARNVVRQGSASHDVGPADSTVAAARR